MENKKKKGIEKVFGYIFTTLTIIILALLVYIIAQKMQKKIPSFFGNYIFNIVSESMEDTIPTGSYIIVKKCTPDEVEVNDIITFISEETAIYGYPNTHRVIDIEYDEDGNRVFITKGDANLKEDELGIYDRQIVGKYYKTSSVIKKVADFLFGGGMFLIIIIFAMFTIFSIVSRIIMTVNSEKKEQEDKEKLEAQKQKLIEETIKQLREADKQKENNETATSLVEETVEETVEIIPSLEVLDDENTNESEEIKGEQES